MVALLAVSAARAESMPPEWYAFDAGSLPQRSTRDAFPTDAGIPGPDGTVFDEASYPARLSSQPLVLPADMWMVSASGSQSFLPSGLANAGVSISAGVGGRTDVTVSTSFLDVTGVGGNVYHLLTPNLAIAAHAGGGVVTSQRRQFAWFSAGVPVKFALHGLPLAIRAFDSVLVAETGPNGFFQYFDTYLPSAGVLRVDIDLPVSVTFSPSEWFSVEAFGSVHSWLGPPDTATLLQRCAFLGVTTLRGGAALVVTSRHLDVGLAVTAWLQTTAQWVTASGEITLRW